ncbi:MAG: hypothetical protein ABIR24_12885 [Verrucomicrobiota bacterium]
MSRKQNFPSGKSIEENSARALFGALTDRVGQKIFSSVALWPDSEKGFTDSLGNYAKIVRWTAKRKGRQQRFTEARVHRAIDTLLEILVPALCRRDATPFKLFADAIEATNEANSVSFHALNLACELNGYAPPFNAVGERSAAEPGELKRLPKNFSALPVAMSESDFRRKIEAFSSQKIEAGNFHRLCQSLKITFLKDRRKGGRPSRKVVL